MEVAILQWTRLGPHPDTKKRLHLISKRSGHVLETGWAWAPPRLCIIFWHHRVNYAGRIGCDWPGTARGMHTSCSTGSTIGVYGVEFSGDPRDDPGTVPCTKCTGSARHGREWCVLSAQCSVLWYFAHVNATVWQSVLGAVLVHKNAGTIT